MLKHPHHRILLLLLAGALFLWFYGSAQAYRSDEVWSLRTVALPYSQMMEEIRNDVHPPLYYWMLAAWTRVAGTDEITARLLSILLMLGAAAAVYFGGRDRLGERGGLVAAALFIASPLSGVAAQMVRMYGLLALVSAVSTAAYLRLSGGEARKRDWALYIVANIAGSFTHVWFFFLLFAQGCAYVALGGRLQPAAGLQPGSAGPIEIGPQAKACPPGLGKMMAAAAASLAPYGVLWLPVLLRQVQKTDSALAWAPPPGFADAGQTALLLGGLFLAAIPFLKSWWSGTGENRWKAAEPALIAVLVVVVPFVLSQYKPVFWPRFTIVALPALSMAIAAFAPAVKKHYFETALVGAAAVLAIMLSLTISRCDSRSAAHYLANRTQTGDTVIFTNLSRLPIDYYWDQIQPDRLVRERSFPAEIDEHPGFVGKQDGLREEAAAVVAGLDQPGGARVVLLHGFRPAEDAPLKTLLDAQLNPVPSLSMDCGAMGSYFQYLSAYSCGR